MYEEKMTQLLMDLKKLDDDPDTTPEQLDEFISKRINEITMEVLEPLNQYCNQLVIENKGYSRTMYVPIYYLIATMENAMSVILQNVLNEEGETFHNACKAFASMNARLMHKYTVFSERVKR